MDKVIKADLYRYSGLNGAYGLFRGLFIPGFRYTYLLRRASKYSKNSLRRYFFSFIKRRYSYKYGYQIPTTTKIGEGFYISHYGTIVINENAVIGKNCNIAHGVTIGRTNRGKLKGSPTIGNNVWIGTGSVIVGAIQIGSNVLIAPNSFVNNDIPSNSLVIGNPSEIVQKDNPCEGYINFVLE
jgi:serine O-acetyltransferase